MALFVKHAPLERDGVFIIYVRTSIIRRTYACNKFYTLFCGEYETSSKWKIVIVEFAKYNSLSLIKFQKLIMIIHNFTSFTFNVLIGSQNLDIFHCETDVHKYI